MTLAEYRTTYSWQSAIALGPKLVRLTEDLPAHEQTGLVMQLQNLMVELPARIAQDLVDGTSERFLAYHRLVAAVELIESVYPALDTTDARTATDAMADRLSGAAFTQTSTSSTAAGHDDEASAGRIDEPGGPAQPQSGVAPVQSDGDTHYDARPTANAGYDQTTTYPEPVQRGDNQVPLQQMTHQQPTSVYVQPDRG